MHACGDDHLDADTVVLKARREDRNGKKDAAGSGGRPAEPAPRVAARPPRRRGSWSSAATRSPPRSRRPKRASPRSTGSSRERRFFETTPPDRVKALKAERARLQEKVERLMEDWESLERELAAVR